jgi:hypothetical protein
VGARRGPLAGAVILPVSGASKALLAARRFGRVSKGMTFVQVLTPAAKPVWPPGLWEPFNANSRAGTLIVVAPPGEAVVRAFPFPLGSSRLVAVRIGIGRDRTRERIRGVRTASDIDRNVSPCVSW